MRNVRPIAPVTRVWLLLDASFIAPFCNKLKDNLQNHRVLYHVRSCKACFRNPVARFLLTMLGIHLTITSKCDHVMHIQCSTISIQTFESKHNVMADIMDRATLVGDRVVIIGGRGSSCTWSCKEVPPPGSHGLQVTIFKCFQGLTLRGL